MSFQLRLNELYPNNMAEADFVDCSYKALQNYGFNGDNSIACVSVCRDEITRPLAEKIQARWGEAFNFASLAGMLFLGKTGFQAAHHHSPVIEGREHYVYFALPHIAIGLEGGVGVCYRRGRPEASSACGALIAFQKELSEGHVKLELDPDDIEQSLLKQKLFRKLRFGKVPDLPELTTMAYDVIVEDLEKMVNATTNPAHADFAIVTGIQIHGPDGVNYVSPGQIYVSVMGKRYTVTL